MSASDKLDRTEIGSRIYDAVLSDRRGFRQDQLGIDDDIWEEIMDELGDAIVNEAERINNIGDVS